MIKFGSWEFPPSKKTETANAAPDRHASEKAAAALAAALAASSPGIAEAQTQPAPPIIESPARTDAGPETQINSVEVFRKLREDFTAQYREGDPTSISPTIFDPRIFGEVTVDDSQTVEDATVPGGVVRYRIFNMRYRQGQGSILQMRLSSLGEVAVSSPIIDPALPADIYRFNAQNNPGSTVFTRFDQAAVLLRAMLSIDPTKGRNNFDRPF